MKKSDTMAQLYGNENFDLQVVEHLRNLGYNILTSQEAGKSNQRIPDEEVLDFAISEKRTVLTFNRKDFESAQKGMVNVLPKSSSAAPNALSMGIFSPPKRTSAIQFQPALSGYKIFSGSIKSIPTIAALLPALTTQITRPSQIESTKQFLKESPLTGSWFGSIVPMFERRCFTPARTLAQAGLSFLLGKTHEFSFPGFLH